MTMVTQDLYDPTPERDNGEAWPHVMLTATSAYYADEAADLVKLFIEDYDPADPYADVVLADGAVEVADRLQTEIINNAVRDGQLDLGDEELLTLLKSDKSQPIAVREDGATLHYEATESQPGLILANTAYVRDDGSLMPMPEGSGVGIVDGSGEIEFIRSLEAMGIVGYAVPDHATV